jgi:hypothetical protein
MVRRYQLRYVTQGDKMYDMTDTAEKKEKMISTRVTEQNIDSMDKVARSQGISRSQWIRRAILAQLVMDLVELKGESEPRETPAEHVPWNEVPESFKQGVRDHDDWCILPIHHEGDCTPEPQVTVALEDYGPVTIGDPDGEPVLFVPPEIDYDAPVTTVEPGSVIRLSPEGGEVIPPNPYLEDLAPAHEDDLVTVALETAHHIDCIKSIDHEGACLD